LYQKGKSAMPPFNPAPYSAVIYYQVLVELRKITQFSNLHSRWLFKSTGLTGPQLMVLREIAANEGIAASEIAKAISLSPSTLTGVLKRLEKRHLITRAHSPKDRRKVLLETTPAGDAVLATEPSLMQESFVDGFSELQKWEQTMILTVLRRLVALMEYPGMQMRPPGDGDLTVLGHGSLNGRK
jgi:DNA-binding MarR family transcriptional regulator